jgi:Cytochrome oxidase complex assembly protein 1
MTTKKLLVIIVSIALTLTFLVVVFVGGIIGIAFYSIGHSEAAETAKDFLRNNERLKEDIGEVKDFGSFVTGNVNFANNDGNATITLKVYGERKVVNATVELIYRNGRAWRVTSASYRTPEGETIELLNPYNSQNHLPQLAA